MPELTRAVYRTICAISIGILSLLTKSPFPLAFCVAESGKPHGFTGNGHCRCSFNRAKRLPRCPLPVEITTAEDSVAV
jgi:hypothetical protein